MNALELQPVVADDLVGQAMLLNGIPEQEDYVGLIPAGAPPGREDEPRAIVDESQEGEFSQGPEAILALEIDLPEFVGTLALKFDVPLTIPGFTPGPAEVPQDPADGFYGGALVPLVLLQQLVDSYRVSSGNLVLERLDAVAGLLAVDLGPRPLEPGACPVAGLLVAIELDPAVDGLPADRQGRRDRGDGPLLLVTEEEGGLDRVLPHIFGGFFGFFICHHAMKHLRHGMMLPRPGGHIARHNRDATNGYISRSRPPAP